MSSSPTDERFQRLLDDASRKDITAAFDLAKRLFGYAGVPGVADNPERMSVREDLIVNIVSHGIDARSRAAGADQPYRVLDACCGPGGLASHLASNLSGGAKNLAYVGIDHSSKFINDGRKKHSKFPTKLKSVEFELREVWNLKSLAEPSFNLVVLSNTLHELSPHRFPELFSCFNEIIDKASGQVCVIDMQELPIGAPEAIAINWKLEELEAVLRSGGFAVVPSKYQKSVGVLCVVVKYSESVDRVAMLREIRNQLQKKLTAFANDRAEAAAVAAESNDNLMNWIVVTGSTARCAEELLLVDAEIAKSAAVSGAEPVVGAPSTQSAPVPRKRQPSSKPKK